MSKFFAAASVLLFSAAVVQADEPKTEAWKIDTASTSTILRIPVSKPAASPLSYQSKRVSFKGDSLEMNENAVLKLGLLKISAERIVVNFDSVAGEAKKLAVVKTMGPAKVEIQETGKLPVTLSGQDLVLAPATK